MYPRAKDREGERRIRHLLWLAAAVNFVTAGGALISSVLYHLFDVRPLLIEWTGDDPPTKPYLLWIFLGYGLLWGVFYLFISAAPVVRRPWMKAVLAQKVLTLVAVWTSYLVVDEIGPGLALLVLLTDLASGLVFVWALHRAKQLSTGQLTSAGEADRGTFRVGPAGSSPPARWSLRLASYATVMAAGAVLAGSIRRESTSPPQCGAAATDIEPCTALGTTGLWSDPQFLVWIWAGMELIMATAMIWASNDVVRRRDIIPFGTSAKFIPVIALIIAQFTTAAAGNPPNPFSWLVISVELMLALLIWLAYRWANASALTLGQDNAEPSEEGP